MANKNYPASEAHADLPAAIAVAVLT